MNAKRQVFRKNIIFFSFLFFPFTVFYFSPFLIIWASMYGILCGSMILFAIQFLSSLLFGRAFCSWVCPGAGIQQCCVVVTKKKARNGKARFVKYIIFVPWLAAIVILLFRAGGIKIIDPLFMTNNGMPMLGIEGYIIYFGIILLFVILSLVLGTRTFCHTFCWMAPFMVIGTKIKDKLGYPSLRLQARSETCTGCKQCTKICPMGLDVEQMVKTESLKNSECILCGECADICRFKAIKLGWGKKS